MNRAEFQDLAAVRIAEAKVLLDQGKPDGAYYLADYAVECGLKACIAKLTSQYDFPQGKAFVDKCYSHDLEKLVAAADLETQIDAEIDADPDFEANWVNVNDWSEQARYERKTLAEAQKLYDAITDANHGVLTCIKKHW